MVLERVRSAVVEGFEEMVWTERVGFDSTTVAGRVLYVDAGTDGTEDVLDATRMLG